MVTSKDIGRTASTEATVEATVKLATHLLTGPDLSDEELDELCDEVLGALSENPATTVGFPRDGVRSRSRKGADPRATARPRLASAKDDEPPVRDGEV